MGLEGQDAEQVVDRVIDVGAFGGGLSGRHPPQAQQGHHVVDTQRAAGAHVGAEQIHHGLVGRLEQLVRVHGGQAPVLAERAQNIGRRTDRGFRAVEIPVGPDLGGTFGDTHRQIAVDPHHHARRLGTGVGPGQLLVGQELQIEVEIHILAVLGHPVRHFRIVVVAERLRPHRPAPGIFALGIEVGLQGIEGGLLLQAVAAGGDECIESGLTLGAEARLIEHLTQHAELGLDDAGVIHVALGTQLAQMLLESRACHFRLEACVPLEFGYSLHIDVGHVEPASGRGAVRAGALRVGRIEGMDRVEADEVGAPGGHLLDQLTQIAEIADAPVVAAAQAVELYARAPHLAAIGDGRLLVARLGRDDEAHAGERLVVALLQQDQIVITQLGLHIQGHAIGLALHLFEFGHADQLTVDGGELTGQQAALLQLELPGEGVVDEFDG